MSIATQVKRLQNVRNQIRTKMVALGLSKNTDLLQDLADDLDGVNKISPTNNGTTDPGIGYTNVDTLSRSTSTRYIKVPKGYNDADRKFTVSGVANGAYSASVSSHTTSNAAASSSVTGSVTDVTTTTKPSGTDGTDYYTITPKLTTTAGLSKATGKATIDAAGYLDAGNKSSSESSKTVEVTASQGDDYYLQSSVVTKENPGVDPGASYLNRATVDSSTEDQYVKITGGYLPDSKITFKKMPEGSISSATIDDPGADYTNRTTVTPAKKRQYVKIDKGYLPNGKITVEAISSSSFDTSGVTATADTVLKDYKFVDSNGITVTGTIATATSNAVSGNVSGSNPDKILLTTEKTSGSSSTTATAEATVAKKLYTGSSDIVKSLTSKTLTATAEATLATATTSSTTVPSTLPAGTVTITPSADNTKRIYSDTKSNGFITNVVLNPMSAGAYSASVASHTTSNATASSNVSGSIINVTSATKPSGTDGSDYFTITPTLTTSAGSSKATGKATVDTAGYLVTGNTTSSESSKTVGVTATQGSNYYLKASSVTKENPGVDPGNRYGNRATVDPSMVDQYVKITGGYLSDSKITIKKMTEGSVSSATTTDPGTENQTTVTPSLDKQYVKISAGHLPHSKITVEAIPNQKKSSDVSAEVSASISNITSIDASQVTSGVTVTASASGNMTVPLGYYSSAVTSTPTDSASTTIKPTLAGTNSDGAVSITASTTDVVKTSAGDYSNGFITKVTVSPTPSEEKTATPSNTTQTVTPKAGKLLSKVTINAIPSPYYNTSGVTATASTVLKDYKFVNSSGTTVTGTIATASSSNISGSVSGSNPEKITLTTEKTSGSSSTTATASATVTKGLYTGSSNIEKDLTSQDFTATAEATLAASVTGTDKIPNLLPPGTVEITPNTDNTKRIYSDTTTNKGFITNVVLKPMSTSSVTIPDPNKDPGTDYTNQVTVTPSGTSAKYVKITAGHLPNSKITVEKMAGGSVASATTTKPDTSSISYPNQTTVIPTKTTQYVKITAGYLPNSKITVDAIPSTTLTVAENAWTKLTSATKLGSYSQTVTGVTGVLTDSDVVVVPDSSSVVALCGVYASGQGASSITFKAFDKPTSNISYKVYILNK